MWKGGYMSRDASRQYVTAYFAGKDIYVRSRGRHFHADPECSVIRRHSGSDVYHRSSYQLDEAGQPNLTNYEDDAYEPCRCASRRVPRG
jgi:hypothetical protein